MLSSQASKSAPQTLGGATPRGVTPTHIPIAFPISIGDLRAGHADAISAVGTRGSNPRGKFVSRVALGEDAPVIATFGLLQSQLDGIAGLALAFDVVGAILL